MNAALSLPRLLAIAALSGAAVLGYEVSWSRMLVVPLGNSAQATAIVLAAFLLGMAAGSWLVGRAVDKARSPLRLYAALELGLCITALAVPSLVRALGSAESMMGSFEEHPFAAMARFGAALAIVGAPALAMGASLPALVKAAAATAAVQNRVGLVYGLNTLGAAAGAALTGFSFVPSLGHDNASRIAAASSGLAALLAFVASRRVRLNEDPHACSALDAPLLLRPVALLALGAAAVCGFSMLSAEVIWMRLSTFVFGHDTYAFSALLVVVLLGLGLGGALQRVFARRDLQMATAVALGLLAALGLGSFWLASAAVVELGRDPFGLGLSPFFAESLYLEVYRAMAWLALLALLPSMAAGVAFPFACALYASASTDVGRRVGTAALVNGIGAAAGALGTSFWIIPALGIERSFVVSMLSCTAVAALLGGFAPPRRRLAALLPTGACVVLVAMMPAELPRALFKEAVGQRHQNVVLYREGSSATVAVTENAINRERQLFVNAVNEVTTRLVHVQSFKLLGHLGPLLHERPRHGLMICLGAGLSAGAQLTHPLERLDVVELSSSMPLAARRWADHNNRALDDPRLVLHVEDGRQFLRTSSARYDVVTVDSTHPKAVDSWILYTREFYELVRSRLAAGGLVVQWVPLHGLSEREFKILVATFYSVFENTTLWVSVGFEPYGQAAYVKMVGTLQPLVIDFEKLSKRLANLLVKRDLEPLGMADPVSILGSFLAGPSALSVWTAGLPIQTDERPIVPFTTEYSYGRRMEPPLLLAVQSPVEALFANTGNLEQGLSDRLGQAREATGFLLAGMLERAAEALPADPGLELFRQELQKGPAYYRALAGRYPDKGDKLFEIGSYLGNLGYADEAARLYKEARRLRPEDPRPAVNLALLNLDRGEVESAVSLLRAEVSRSPDSALMRYDLGVALAAQGEGPAAVEELARAAAWAPWLFGARLALAEALLGQEQVDRASSVLDAVVAENPWIAEAFDLQGLVAARRSDYETAAKKHARAAQLDPYRAAAHYNLGIALQELSSFEAALLAYRAALRIDPQDAEAANNLGLVYAAVGRYEQAAEFHTRALEIAPSYAEAAYNLALANAALGRREQAATALHTALELNPNLEPAKEKLEQLEGNL